MSVSLFVFPIFMTIWLSLNLAEKEISCIRETLHDWQALVAGVLGFLAATGAVYMTLLSERRHRDREQRDLFIAISSELRLFAYHALEAFKHFETLLKEGQPVTVHQLENSIRFGAPVIFHANAARVGLLKDAAHDLIYFYICVADINSGIARIKRDIGDDEIGSDNTTTIQDALLKILPASIRALTAIGGAFPSDHNFDKNFSNEVDGILLRRPTDVRAKN